MTKADPLLKCLEGTISAETALARLLLAGESPAAIRRRIEEVRGPGKTWIELVRLTQCGPRLDRLRRMLDAARVDHSDAALPAGIAASFDRAVAISPEASVAVYSLGDRALLQAATDEILEWLNKENLLDPELDVLDLGCGIGRVSAAIAPYVRTVVGADISRGMLREARIRCVHQANISFVIASGLDLAVFGDATFDMILAVDTFPYLMQAGVAECHVAEARRVLRPKGWLALINLSYRACPEKDQTDAEAWARTYSYSLRRAGISPFRMWDGLCYVFECI